MGNCEGYPPSDPVTINHCNDYFTERDTAYIAKDFCTIPAFSGRPYKEEFCSSLGSEGEWGEYGFLGGTGECIYNSCAPYQTMGLGCCDGCCGILGTYAICTRQKFNGNPIQCCLNDKVCSDPDPGDPDRHTDAPASCFSDPEKKDTCAPCHRDIASTSTSKPDGSKFSCADKGLTPCQDLMLSYCSGADGDPDWIDRWYNPNTGEVVPQSCEYALKRILFNIYPDNTIFSCQASNVPLTNSAGICTPINFPLSAEGTEWGRTLMNAVLARYSADGYVLGAPPGSPQYNPFQDYLYQLGCSVPVIMQDGLRNACSIYSADTASRNPTVSNFCGCYLPDSEYSTYVDQYQINKECTPICNRRSTIPIISSDNQPYRCNQTVCIIDDISINIANSNVGDIGISQVCGNCGQNASCTCIVSSNAIEAVNANVGGINLSTQCSSSTCSIPGRTGTIPCSEINNPPTPTIDTNSNMFKLIIFGGIILLLILAILFSYTPTTKPSGRTSKS